MSEQRKVSPQIFIAEDSQSDREGLIRALTSLDYSEEMIVAVDNFDAAEKAIQQFSPGQIRVALIDGCLSGRPLSWWEGKVIALQLLEKCPHALLISISSMELGDPFAYHLNKITLSPGSQLVEVIEQIFGGIEERAASTSTKSVEQFGEIES